MKKFLFISAILSLSVISCKKNYTCVCNASILGTTIIVKTEAKSTKGGATNWCKGLQNSNETVNDTTSASFPLTCAIQ